MAKGHLSDEDFAGVNREAEAALRELRDHLAPCESNTLDVETAFSYLQFLLWNTYTVWETDDLRGKQRLQRRVFPNGLSWIQNGFGTPVTHSLYPLLASDSLTDRDLVAPQGFEPRLIGSEPTVLPLNEGAIQIEYGSCRLGREPQSAACLSVFGAGEWVNSEPLRLYSSRKTSNGFCPSTR